MLAEYRRIYYINLKEELQGGSIKFQFLTIGAVWNAVILDQSDTFEKMLWISLLEKFEFLFD